LSVYRLLILPAKAYWAARNLRLGRGFDIAGIDLSGTTKTGLLVSSFQ